MARFNQVTGKYEEATDSFAEMAKRAREAEAARLAPKKYADNEAFRQGMTRPDLPVPVVPASVATEADVREAGLTQGTARGVSTIAGNNTTPYYPRFHGYGDTTLRPLSSHTGAGPDLTAPTPPATVEEAPRPMDLRAAFEQASKGATPRDMDLVAPAATPLPTAGKTFRDYVPQGSGMVETMAGFGQMRREQGMQDAGTLMSIRKDLASQLEQEKLAGEKALLGDRVAGEMSLAQVKGSATKPFEAQKFGLSVLAEQAKPLVDEINALNKQLTTDSMLAADPLKAAPIKLRKAELEKNYDLLFKKLALPD